jgi:hypothetical protein
MITQSLILLAAVAQGQNVQLKPSAIDDQITVKGPVYSIPQVGFGTWMIPPNDAGTEAVAHAIKLGYRHLDGATAYTNQEAVGKGIVKALAEDKSIKREDLWITTKLWATAHKAVESGTDMNLKQLGLDYLDLQLVHFPIGNTQKPKLDDQGQPVIGPDRKPVNETVAEFDYVEVSLLAGMMRTNDILTRDRCGKKWKKHSSRMLKAAAKFDTSASPTSTSLRSKISYPRPKSNP